MRVEDECPGGASDPRQNESDEDVCSMTGRCLGAGGRFHCRVWGIKVWPWKTRDIRGRIRFEIRL